jgi:hypothetical protein
MYCDCNFVLFKYNYMLLFPRQTEHTVEWSVHMLRVREVLVSNLDPETGYREWNSSCVSSAP